MTAVSAFSYAGYALSPDATGNNIVHASSVTSTTPQQKLLVAMQNKLAEKNIAVVGGDFGNGSNEFVS
ncbi:hypothetical protein [Weissella sp. LMG 11983]|uniref:hypothetical protein n=1 Tax=Weissella sp. LMG 11983 TaxID=2987700 RepID=UPI0021F8BE5F|nr:hypothetical protein [Weissella sp. LMG 11983]MCW0928045.1 hypothetical protein [Weissella sp. LMG 11983]